VFIENLSASLIGGIQPEPIRKVADDSADDGLLQRLLPVILKPAVEGRDEQASEVVFDYAALIRRLYQLDRPLFGGVADGTVLRFDEKAQAYRQELERKHLDLQSCESINRKLASHIGKYDGIFARLCIVWHCVEAAPGALPRVISEETARRAGAFLHGFLLPHAIAFYAGVLGLFTTTTGWRRLPAISLPANWSASPTGTSSTATGPRAVLVGRRPKRFLTSSTPWGGSIAPPDRARHHLRNGSSTPSFIPSLPNGQPTRQSAGRVSARLSLP